MKATFLIALLVHTLMAAPSGFAQPAEVVSDSLALAQTALSQLRDQVSAFDMSLVEPLNSLADQQMRSGQLEQAHRTLDRAMQIVRVNQGLFTSAQHPLLHKKIENLASQGNWEDARAQLDHLFYLYTKKQKFVTQEMISGFGQLSDIHLRAISEDSNEYQGFHFSRAATGNWLALAIGEALWGKEDPRLVPLIYEVMNQFHLEYVAINQGGRVGIEIRTVVPGSNWVRQISEMRQYYLANGAGLIGQLRAIYSSEALFDQEAIAMVDLYLADWLSLFDQHEQVLAAYSKAYQNLLAANVDAQELDRFFATPRLLPEPQFFPSLSLALEAQGVEIDVATMDAELGIDTEAKLFFAEWSPGFPYAQQPSRLGGPRANSTEFAIFSFNIGGLPDIARLLDGRRPLGFGAVENVTALSAMPESEYKQRKILNRVGSLRFRPKLVGGVPHEIDATLIYAVAAPFKP
jgi:hypothetical protein